MRTRVTNLSGGARGFHTAGGTVMVEPGAGAVLDLADHPAHDAWVAAGEVAMTPDEEAEAPSGTRAKAPPRAPRGRDA